MKIFVKINSEYKELEIYSTERISVTYMFDDLSNPSHILSDFSESFNIPKTAHNNIIFSEFVKFDNKLTQYGYTPAEFMECIITNNSNDVVMVGKCYIKKITDSDYQLDVSGSLFSIFKNIKDIDFDKPLKLHKVNGSLVETGIPNVITASNVYESWVTSVRSSTGMYAVDMSVTPTDIYLNGYVGWGMVNGDDYADFSNDKWLYRPYFNMSQFSASSSTDISVHKSCYARIGDNLCDGVILFPEVEDSNIVFNNKYIYIKDENSVINSEAYEVSANENQMQEFRSYYQHPYLRLKKWFDYVGSELYTSTGYTLQIADGVVEDEAIYVLPRFYDGDSKSDIKGSESLSFTSLTSSISMMKEWFIPAGFYLTNPPTATDMPKLRAYSKNHSVKPQDIDEINIKCQVDIISAAGVEYNGYKNPILINLGVGNGLQPRKIALVPVPLGFDINNVNNKNVEKIPDYYADLGYELYFCDYIKRSDGYLQIDVDVTSKISGCDDGKKEKSMDYDIEFTVELANLYAPHYPSSDVNNTYYTEGFLMRMHDLSGSITTKESNRTGKVINIENLLKGQNMLDIIITYTKLKHAVWIVDETTKTLKIKRCEDYLGEQFFNSGVLDFTDKIDFSKLEQYPMSWDNEVVQMKHKDSDIITDYDTKKIVTPNHINTNSDTLNIFDENYCCIMTQKTQRVLDELRKENVKQSPYILPYTANGNVNFFAYDNWSNADQHKFIEPKRLQQSGSRTGTNNFFITDDTNIERSNNVFCWHSEEMSSGYINNDNKKESDSNRFLRHFYHQQGRPTTSVNYNYRALVTKSRPYITDYNLDQKSVLYSRPEYYLYDRIDDVRTEFVIDRFTPYINQVYNQENRKIEVSAKVTFTDWKRIKRNPFVVVGDVLFLVTSLEYWNDNDCLCKVVMRKISDVYDMVDDRLNPYIDDVTFTVNGGEHCYTYTFTKTIKKGDKIGVSCVPDDGYVFVGWYSGNTLISVYPNTTLTVTDNMTISPRTTKYNEGYYLWDVIGEHCGTLSEYTNARYQPNTQITCGVGLVEQGYVFSHWLDRDSGEIFSTDRNISVLLDRDYRLEMICERDESIQVKELDTELQRIKLTIE